MLDNATVRRELSFGIGGSQNIEELQFSVKTVEEPQPEIVELVQNGGKLYAYAAGACLMNAAYTIFHGASPQETPMRLDFKLICMSVDAAEPQ